MTAFVPFTPSTALQNPRLPHSRLSPHPHLFVLCPGPLNIAQLHLPDLELVVSPVRPAREEVERPVVLWACYPCAQDDAKVLNIEWDAL